MRLINVDIELKWKVYRLALLRELLKSISFRILLIEIVCIIETDARPSPGHASHSINLFVFKSHHMQFDSVVKSLQRSQLIAWCKSWYKFVLYFTQFILCPLLLLHIVDRHVNALVSLPFRFRLLPFINLDPLAVRCVYFMCLLDFITIEFLLKTF